MRKTMIQLSTLVLLAGMTLTPPAFGKNIPNGKMQTIDNEVRHELIMLPYYGVFDYFQFKVDGSKVTLLGYAREPWLKRDAGAAVKSIEGVQSVDNQIKVLPVSPFDDQIRVAAYRAIYGNENFWNYAIMAVPSIHIVVNNGNITLEGVVGSELDKTLAYHQVSGIAGVFSVTNDLRVVKG
jgi:hyperosmotically inducible protein